MAIILDRITEREKLIIAKGLLDYQFIMDNWKRNTKDFQDVYYEFYLKARWAIMKNSQNSDAYFDVLGSIGSNAEIMNVIEALRSKLGSDQYEFSICSKLLHTVNPNSPIYDSKVRKYLSKEEKVKLCFHTNKNIDKKEKIEKDWQAICNWYKNFLGSERGKEWIAWFDENFPSYSSISDYKKIDFIIFATN